MENDKDDNCEILQRISKLKRFKDIITSVDLHACGEPGRVIISGVSEIPGNTMFEKMKYFSEHKDEIRLRLLREPRGYPALCCNIIVEPTLPQASAGYIIMEQTEYPPMSGTNTICVATTLLELGFIPMIEPITKFELEAPAGLIGISARCHNNKVEKITFKNVPSFAVQIGVTVNVPHLGPVIVDIAWGGMFYVIADASQFDLQLIPEEGKKITKISEMIRKATREQFPVIHPDNPDVIGPTISQLTSTKTTNPIAHSKNVVTVATGDVDWSNPSTWTGVIDRSPCGTGTCALMSVLYAKGKLKLNEEFHHEGILGTIFTGELIEERKVGSYNAVVPLISGTAWITSINHHVVDPLDPFPNGYTVGDLW